MAKPLHILDALKKASSSDPSTNAFLTRLTNRSAHQQTLKNLLKNLLPDTIDPDRLHIRQDGKNLTLVAENNAQATKLRQLKNSMIEHFTQNGHPFEHVYVIVNTINSLSKPEPLHISKPILSEETLLNMSQCAANLQNSPRCAQHLSQIVEIVRKKQQEKNQS